MRTSMVKYYCLGCDCMRLDYQGIFTGSYFLILNTIFFYLLNPSLVYVPSSLALLTVIVSGVFEFKKYYNKYAYMAVIAVILVVMWGFNFIQPLPPDEDIIIYYFMIGFFTLLIFILVIWTLKRWIKNEKALKQYDNALKTNPNDITALNNKGVLLTIMIKYDDAMECFNKVLEIAPEDDITLQNKNMLEMKLQNKTFYKQMSDKPELEITEKDEKSILEIKKK